MGAMQRRKGAAGEREWCKQLAPVAPGATRDIDQSRDGGGDVRVPPFLYEVKRYAKFAIYEHMDQAIVSANKHNMLPAVALRGDNRDWLVVLRAEDFIDLLKLEAIYGKRNP